MGAGWAGAVLYTKTQQHDTSRAETSFSTLCAVCKVHLSVCLLRGTTKDYERSVVSVA